MKHPKRTPVVLRVFRILVGRPRNSSVAKMHSSKSAEKMKMKMTVGELRSLRDLPDEERCERWGYIYVHWDRDDLEPDVCEYLREWIFPSSVFGEQFRSKFTYDAVRDYIEFNTHLYVSSNHELTAMFFMGYAKTHKYIFREMVDGKFVPGSVVGDAILVRAERLMSEDGIGRINVTANGDLVCSLMGADGKYHSRETDLERYIYNKYPQKEDSYEKFLAIGNAQYVADSYALYVQKFHQPSRLDMAIGKFNFPARVYKYE